MQSWKGGQPGKVTAGTCNPPQVICLVLDTLHLISDSKRGVFFWYLHLGFRHRYLKYLNRNFLV